MIEKSENTSCVRLANHLALDSVAKRLRFPANTTLISSDTSLEVQIRPRAVSEEKPARLCPGPASFVKNETPDVRNMPNAICPVKYQRWYEQIISAAQARPTPRCYSEVHHIKPRSLGGSDDPANLVRLTYREHFLVHWILTKVCVGSDRFAMVSALHAMTLTIDGLRLVAGWQVDAAKRAVRDRQDDAGRQAEWRRSYIAEKRTSIQKRDDAIIDVRNRRDKLRAEIHSVVRPGMKPDELKALATAMLKHVKKPKDWLSPNAPDRAKAKYHEKIRKAEIAAFPDIFEQTAASQTSA